MDTAATPARGVGPVPASRRSWASDLARSAITATTKPMTFTSQMLPVPSTFATSPPLEALERSYPHLATARPETVAADPALTATLEHTLPRTAAVAPIFTSVLTPASKASTYNSIHSHLTLGKPAPPARLCVPDTAVSWWIGSACEQVTLPARRSQRGYVLATSLLPAVQVR